MATKIGAVRYPRKGGPVSDAKTFHSTELAGTRLKAAMAALGVEPPELADFLGIERQSVWRWAAGERLPSGQYGAWLPLLLRTTPWNLFGWPPGFTDGGRRPPPVPDGTTLAEAFLGERGAILALPSPTAGAGPGVGGVESLATEVIAMLHRALAKALRQTFAHDEASMTQGGRLALADALERFADDLHDNAGCDVHDITRVVRLLRKGLPL